MDVIRSDKKAPGSYREGLRTINSGPKEFFANGIHGRDVMRLDVDVVDGFGRSVPYVGARALAPDLLQEAEFEGTGLVIPPDERLECPGNQR